MEPVIRVEGLSKTFKSPVKKEGFGGTIRGLLKPEYKEVTAVDHVSFEVGSGEFVGFLGPNGAGKTTTIKMLSGILFPTGGEGEVLGYTPFDRRPEMLRQIALVMGNRQQLWWDLPAWESFVVLREVYGVDEASFKQRLDELIDQLNLADKVQTQVRKLSLGERMKCELVAALLHNPRVVFLDEPTIGLDLVSQRNIRAFLKNYNKTTGATVLLTSHYMQDVEELCPRVVIINHGRKVYDGALAELTSQYADFKRLNLVLSEPVSRETWEPYGEVVEEDAGRVVLEIRASDVASITAKVLSDFPVQDLSIADTEVEEVIEKAFESGSAAVEPV